MNLSSLGFFRTLNKSNQQFAVIGLGRFGRSVCSTLHRLGYEVLATDIDEKRVSQALTEEITGHGPMVLLVATEWFSLHGGLSTFNRELCCGLATVGARVYCYVPHCSQEEKESATSVGVTLVAARNLPGATELELMAQRPIDAGQFFPDIIIGHDRITGVAARLLATNYYERAKLVTFIHTSPSEIEWHKEHGAEGFTAERAEYKRNVQVDLATNSPLCRCRRRSPRR